MNSLECHMTCIIYECGPFMQPIQLRQELSDPTHYTTMRSNRELADDPHRLVRLTRAQQRNFDDIL